MSKRSNSNNNAKKARHHASPAAHERPEDAKARAGAARETGAGFDNKARNAADRFEREATHSAQGAHAHAGGGASVGADRAGADRAGADRAGADRAGATRSGGARDGGARDEARAKTRDR